MFKTKNIVHNFFIKSDANKNKNLTSEKKSAPICATCSMCASAFAKQDSRSYYLKRTQHSGKRWKIGIRKQHLRMPNGSQGTGLR